MRGGGREDEEQIGHSEDAVSPYLKPDKPERKSVIPPSKESFVFPSGRVARPVEEYLESDEARSDGKENDIEGGEGPEAEESAWPRRSAGEGDDARSGGSGHTPRWVPWVGLGSLGAGILTAALMGAFGSGPAPDMSGSPSGSVTPEVPSAFNDGIAEDEYPEPIPWRGEGYPEALTMEDWVWGRTGPGWALVIFAESSSVDSATFPIPVVYLVSPEGVYFELSELPGRVANGATVVSWHEDDRAARIIWDGGTRGGRLDLETGNVEDTSFGLTSGRTKDVQFLAANAADKEIWSAWGPDGLETRHYAWTPDAEWERILTGQDDLLIEWFVNPTSPDSSAVAFQIFTLADSLYASERSLPPGVPNLVVYSLDTGEDHRYLPAVPYAEPNCWFTGWIDGVSVGYSCWDDVTTTETAYTVYVDGSGRVEEDDGSGPWYTRLLGNETVQHPTEPIELVVDSDTAGVVGVRVLKDTEAVTVIDLDMLGGSGHTISTFNEVSSGVFRLVTADTIVIGIDIETATVGLIVPAMTASGVPLMGRSYVFYGEATLSGSGLDWVWY